MLCWILHYVWYRSVFLMVYSLQSLHILNLFLSWILSYQYLHMIAFPGLIISILFCCRISYSILAHFIWSIYCLSCLLLWASSFIYIPLCHIYAGILPYCGSVTICLHRYSSILWLCYNHIHTGILPYCGYVTIISTQVFLHNVVVLQFTYTGILPYCGSVTIYLQRYSSILW